MKKITGILLVFLLHGCATVQQSKNVVTERKAVKAKYTDCEAVRDKLLKGKGFLLIDIRRMSDFNEKHIEGSISVPLNELAYKKFSRDLEIVTYCGNAACPTSKHAAVNLMERGYGNVKILKGGLDSWVKKGFPVVEKKKNSMDILVPGITADELKKKLDKNDDVVIIDVRSSGEYSAGHIKNALSVPLNKIKDSIRAGDREKEIIVYSRTGKKCMLAAGEFRMAGYINVKTLLGGIMVWEKRGYEVSIK